MEDVYVQLSADAEVESAARCMDWGVVVDSNQGGVSVYVVGLPADDAAGLLRQAARALAAHERSQPNWTIWVKGEEWHVPSGHLGVAREATPSEAESLRLKGWEPVEVAPAQ